MFFEFEYFYITDSHHGCKELKWSVEILSIRGYQEGNGWAQKGGRRHYRLPMRHNVELKKKEYYHLVPHYHLVLVYIIRSFLFILR